MATEVRLEDAALAALNYAKGPLHSLKILEGCFLLKAVPDQSEASHYAVRAAIRKAITADQAAGVPEPRFKDLGRRTFVATKFYNPITHVVETKRAEKRRYSKKTSIAEADRRCGNCKHIAWSGPGFATQQAGDCNAQQKSGRGIVKIWEEPCPVWQQRSNDQIAADKREKQKDQTLIHQTNLKLRGKIRG